MNSEVHRQPVEEGQNRSNVLPLRCSGKEADTSTQTKHHQFCFLVS